MARVKLAPILSDLAGKLSNTVFTMGRSVLAIRTRVKPTNPQTIYQTLVRNAFATWAAAWRALSSANIVAWNEYALTIKKSNRFGDKYYSTGAKTYIAYNTENTIAGDGIEVATPIIPVAPTAVGWGTLDFDSAPQKAALTTTDAVPANTVMQIWATPPVSAGVSNFKGKHTLIKMYPAATGAGILDFTTEYCAKYGTLVADQQVQVKVFLSNVHATSKVVKYTNGADLSTKVK